MLNHNYSGRKCFHKSQNFEYRSVYPFHPRRVNRATKKKNSELPTARTSEIEKPQPQFPILETISRPKIVWFLLDQVANTAINMVSVSAASVELSSYRDQHFKGTRAEQDKLLRLSCTLYVGNLSFYTTEEQIYELFSKCGEIRRIIMGLDKYKKTPCGFCFVEYYIREDSENCLRYINGTRLDDRIVRTDWDAGFIEGRQYGRGKTGGQVRDEYRTDYDAGRGGYGKLIQQKIGTEVPSFLR